jgi:hypothetical protein
LKSFSHIFSFIIDGRFARDRNFALSVMQLTPRPSVWITASSTYLDKPIRSLNQIDRKYVLRKGRDPNLENGTIDL